VWHFLFFGVFENEVLWKILGPKRQEGWRKLHNEERHNLYYSRQMLKSDQIEEDEVVGTCG
jgi:hypothetical protein